jgi:hypothetical protein
MTPKDRADKAQSIRVQAAADERAVTIPANLNNGDEDKYPDRGGSYSKGLPHDANGAVISSAYDSLLKALSSGLWADFEAVKLGGLVPLVDPQSGLAFDLEGTDSHQLELPPAPPVASDVKAAEAVEVYWMALLRDVPFSQYATHPLAEAAAKELSSLPSFSRCLHGTHEPVTAANLFRGFNPGDLEGPYVSQFLYKTLEFGAAEVVQRFQTLLPLWAGGTDWLTDYPTWLAVQNGQGPNALAWKTNMGGLNRVDPVRRYVRGGRDLAQYVHVDVLFEAYFNACLFLIDNGAPLNAGNPYLGSKTQTGFGTFGGPHVKAILAEVATRALKAVWFQKWFVHRHLRPEAYGGLVHNAKTGVKQDVTLPDSILSSRAVARCFSQNGTYLLPHAFPEGCPQHPSYGQGHGTVAGACATIVKAFFDETWKIPDPMVPSDDGLSLVSYTGPGELRVGGEMDKLAANIALGRDHAAVHWRSDYAQSLILGEKLAVSILKDQLDTFNEAGQIKTLGWKFTGFDGKQIKFA